MADSEITIREIMLGLQHLEKKLEKIEKDMLAAIHENNQISREATKELQQRANHTDSRLSLVEQKVAVLENSAGFAGRIWERLILLVSGIIAGAIANSILRGGMS